jgi:hypothetical protein
VRIHIDNGGSTLIAEFTHSRLTVSDTETVSGNSFMPRVTYSDNPGDVFIDQFTGRVYTKNSSEG